MTNGTIRAYTPYTSNSKVQSSLIGDDYRTFIGSQRYRRVMTSDSAKNPRALQRKKFSEAHMKTRLSFK
jgi:hypothetical protein